MKCEVLSHMVGEFTANQFLDKYITIKGTNTAPTASAIGYFLKMHKGVEMVGMVPGGPTLWKRV